MLEYTKLSVDTLIIGNTEKCNMKCRHCLRGNARNNNIDQLMMNKIVDTFDNIFCVTFGAGEITMHLDSIRWFIEAVQFSVKEKYIGNFYIVTNAKVYRKELERLCDVLYNMCGDNEISGLAVSDDQFHREWHRSHYTFLKNFDRYMWGKDYYDEYGKYDDMVEECMKPYADPNGKKVKEWDYSNAGIINMGRAIENGLGVRDLKPYKPTVEFDEDTGEVKLYDGEVFVRYNGDIFCSCNLSYDEMDKGIKSPFYLGSIHNMQAIVDKLWEEQGGENGWN